MYIVNGSVKIFSLRRMPVMVVLAVHHVKVFQISVSNMFNFMLLTRINWRTMLPVVFAFLFEITIICNTVGRCLKQVFNMISVLSLTHLFIEVFLILRVIITVVLAFSNVMTLVPCRRIKRFLRHLISRTLFLVLNPA